ncbi:AAA family ATPase [Deinococcus detaillensis]|uniref:AAA family ATPase n=1 Tax=Deinococcus detaillensis TaxID=2592048 RepID=A0A553V2Q2_9DEIO|nr:ankyrin repeat domain-containing protein [Deinococcus detaillensis]TSA86745.1 AAA family ATPase [Deinococcus detaillensis]
MRFMTYHDLDASKVKKQLAKVREAVERDDFRTPDIKKLAQGQYYRAKLDDTNRLLLTFVKHDSQTICLALEVIHQHAYEKSRFLRGAALDLSKMDSGKFDEAKLLSADSDSPEQISARAHPVRYLHPSRREFHVLDKVISFDDTQDAVYRTPAPVILVGSAGSGKTALTLQKLRELPGQVLYVTLSPYLAQSAAELYAAHGFENESQDVQFLSFKDYLSTIRVPRGREVRFEDFQTWFVRQPNLSFTDAHQLFEEFRGVLSSSPSGPLSREAYLGLGVRQSIYAAEQRPLIDQFFQNYLNWLAEARLYDSSLLAAEYLPQVSPSVDFVVVDEVQDLTAAQLALILRSLKVPGQFLLCGDSNQIVHPNFFSWAAVKTLLWNDPALAERQAINVLRANFRNASQVTRVANDLLKIKHARFGSIDRESNFLVEAVAAEAGSVTFLPDDVRVKKHLDEQTRDSTEYAVLVLRDSDKAGARKVFGTPLVFSVHEAKGLEYPNIILYNFISGERATYRQITEGVELADLQKDNLKYSRAKDKTDKSLEIYKFYVNALYVAVTRAVRRVTLIEADTRHPLLSLLGVELGDEAEQLQVKKASRDDWEREARKLELQGKKEQAGDIRRRILQQKPVPWEVWTPEVLRRMENEVRTQPSDAKVARSLVDFAVLNRSESLLTELRDLKIKPAQAYLRNNAKDRQIQWQAVADKYRKNYESGANPRSVLSDADKYGVDHRTPENLTPLMLAVLAGNLALTEALLERGADVTQTDVFGRTPQILALSRAAQDAQYAQRSLGLIYARVRPAALDVLVSDKLVRLMPEGAEYYFLSMMLALGPNYASTLQDPPLNEAELHKRRTGFYVDSLQLNLDSFAESVLREARRKRSYFNHVLARAEVGSNYQPARKLWQRVKTGFYQLNPDLQVRLKLSANTEGEWVNVALLSDPVARAWLAADTYSAEGVTA